MDDQDRTLAEIRRDLAEAHALANRTHAAMTTLATSLRDVVVRQDKYERNLNLNSFVAYVLFTVLLGTGFYLLYRSRAEVLVEEREAAMRARSEAVAERLAATAKLEEREAGSRKAEEFWKLLTDGRRADLIARMPELAGVKMTTVERQVLEQGAFRSRAELVDASYAAGIEAVRGQQWKRAASELKRALSFEEEGPRALQMRYNLGLALARLGEYPEAIKQLDLAIAGGIEKTGGIDARFWLAAALEATKQLDRARAEYMRFAETHGEHPLAGGARRKANEIVRATRTQ